MVCRCGKFKAEYRDVAGLKSQLVANIWPTFNMTSFSFCSSIRRRNVIFQGIEPQSLALRQAVPGVVCLPMPREPVLVPCLPGDQWPGKVWLALPCRMHLQITPNIKSKHCTFRMPSMAGGLNKDLEIAFRCPHCTGTATA